MSRFTDHEGKVLFMLNAAVERMDSAMTELEAKGLTGSAILMSPEAFNWMCKLRITRNRVPAAFNGMPIYVDPQIEAGSFCVAGE